MIPAITLILLGTVHGAAGLLCYQCQTAGKEGMCISGYEDLLNVAKKVLDPNKTAPVSDDSSVDNFIPHYKDCSPFPNRTMCMIEVVRNVISGDIWSYIRDCSDGYTFNIDLPVLRNLSPTNHSTCGYDARGFQVCVTLCNMTDLCNGPQYKPDTDIASTLSTPSTLLYLATSWCALVELVLK